MKVFNFYPIGHEERQYFHHPNLFEALRVPLEKRGHELTSNFKEATIVNFDTGVWDLHDTDSSIPVGTYSPYDPEIKQWILDNRIPVAIHDNFDHRGTPTYHCPWPGRNDWNDLIPVLHQDWANFCYMLGKTKHPLIYFMRKMQNSAYYPDWVYPLEYPLFDEYPLTDPETLYNRPHDVSFLGEQSETRNNAIHDLKADGRLKLDVHHVPSNKRLHFPDWVDRHKNAKLFMEADCSMGSERPMRLMTIAPMLRIRSDHRIPYPREDMVTQVEVGDYDGHISRFDVDKILRVVNDKDLLYSIYKNGVDHMKTFYSMEARSNYIIDRLETL